MNIIEEHIEKILSKYTKDEFYETLVKAKQDYVNFTGKLNEDTEEYESRMNTFSDWYMFHYHLDNGHKVIDDYLLENDLDPELAKSFHNINYSLFQFVKVNFRKQIVIKDILHNEKYILSKDNGDISLLVDDIFVGRIVTYQGQSYLLKGLCLVPRDALSNLKKEAKKVRKMNDMDEEEKFLLLVESLKTKSLNYSHIEPSRIFVFDKA